MLPFIALAGGESPHPVDSLDLSDLLAIGNSCQRYSVAGEGSQLTPSSQPGAGLPRSRVLPRAAAG